MSEKGLKKVLQNDFLLYNKNYLEHVFNEYKDVCTDMRVTAYQKSPVKINMLS